MKKKQISITTFIIHTVISLLLKKMTHNIKAVEAIHALKNKTCFLCLKIKFKFKTLIRKMGGPPVEHIFKNRLRQVLTISAVNRIN